MHGERQFLAAVLAWSILGCAGQGRDTRVGAPAPATDAGHASAHVAEHWYRVDVDDTPAGWMLSREIVRGDRRTTVSRLHLRLKRAGNEQTLELESRFDETLEGRPLTAWSRQSLGPKPIETTWKFLPKEVLVEIAHGGDTRRQRMPLPPGGWLTPGQVQPQLRQLLAAGVRHFTLNSLDPQLGLEVVATEWILDAAEEEVLVDGAPVSTRRFRQRQSFMPELETVANVTAEGLTVRSTTPMMGFEMTSILSRRDEVLRSRAAPDLLVRTFVHPDRPITAPRRLRRALYEIRRAGSSPATWTGGEFLQSLPSIGAQRVERTGDSARVLVEVGSSPTSDATEIADLEPYLRASTFVDHESAGVRRLLAGALGTIERSPAERAETLRAFVAGYLRDKNLDSILATAGEVAASRSGDCTEHSVLLAALLRASEIPARVVIGLIYVGEMAGERDVFGYHMWTQAWVGDHWVDLDATLAVPFDAAHIAFGTTALNDDQATLAELARFAAFIGRAEIRVLSLE